MSTPGSGWISRRTRPAFVASIAALCCVAACSGDDDSLEEDTSALCAWLTRCEVKIPTLLQGQTGLFCRPDLLSRFVETLTATDRARLDSDRLKACLEEIPADGSCDVFSRRDPPGCDTFVEPLQPPGAPCTSDFECIDGECVGSDNTCEGICRANAKLGEACENDAPECSAGLRCVNSVCEPEGPINQPEGEPCDSTEDCAVGLGCASNVCVPPVPLGAACQPVTFFSLDRCASDLVCADTSCGEGAAIGASCANTPCAPGGRCLEDTQVCKQTRLPGETCETTFQCPSAHACSGGRCAPLPIVGESCEAVDGCLGARCDEGVCTLIPDGEPCEDGVGCAGFCDRSPATPVCVPRRAEGAGCEDDDECTAGTACLGPYDARVCTECNRPSGL
jgi:hypothetical protein